MDRLVYGDCCFQVRWSGSDGAHVASVPGLRLPLTATGSTRWEAFAELDRRLRARLERAKDAALAREAPGYVAHAV